MFNSACKIIFFFLYSKTYQILVGFINVGIILRFLREELETKVASFATGVAANATATAVGQVFDVESFSSGSSSCGGCWSGCRGRIFAAVVPNLVFVHSNSGNWKQNWNLDRKSKIKIKLKIKIKIKLKIRVQLICK